MAMVANHLAVRIKGIESSAAKAESVAAVRSATPVRPSCGLLDRVAVRSVLSRNPWRKILIMEIIMKCLKTSLANLQWLLLAVKNSKMKIILY